MSIQGKLRFVLVVFLVLAAGGLNSTLSAAQTGGGSGGGGDPPPTLEELVAEAQLTFDEGLQLGTISGKGRHFFAYLRVWIMAHSLDQAALAIDELRLDDAFRWLTYAHQCCDDARAPIPDLVGGEDVGALKANILAVIARIVPLL